MDPKMRAVGWLGSATLAYLGRRWRRKRSARKDRLGMPRGEDRLRYVQAVRQMRSTGATLKECKARLRPMGLRKAVADGLVSDVYEEDAKTIAPPVEVEWNGYRFQVPGNWTVQRSADSDGIETSIRIDGGVSFLFQLLFVEGVSHYRRLTEARRETYAVRELVPFESWAGLDGQGVKFLGGETELGAPKRMFFFYLDAQPDPILIAESCLVEEYDNLEPGAKLIERSFAPLQGVV